MFTPEELRNLQVFLSRTQLTGQEAGVMALLQMKVQQLLQPEVKEENKK